MPYTILSATYGNEDNSAAILQTEEAGAVAISTVDTPQDWADLQAWHEAGGVVSAYIGPTRWLVPKSTVTTRLTEAGKISLAMQALLSDPAAFGRWIASDKPAVWSDDPAALGLLQAIGADPATILARP